LVLLYINLYKETFGVDIRKDVFDIHGSRSGYNQYNNDETGFKKLLKELPMDFAAYYHCKLTPFFYTNAVVVSEVNLLLIRRFIKMKLAKGKTDKSDM
jgi:transposase